MGYPDFSKIQRVLVAKLRHHGDVLLTSALFTLLKKRFPHLEIDGYIYKDTLPMLEGHPAISDFILYDKCWKKGSKLLRFFNELKVLSRIRKKKYDLVINLTEGDRGAIAALISQCSYAVGADPRGGGMFGKKKCYTHVVKHGPHPRHTVETGLDFLRILGVFPENNEKELFFHVPTEAINRVKELVGEGEYVLIHPVSRWMFKALPEETIAEVVRFLHKKGNRAVLTASPDPIEVAMNRNIRALIPEIEVCDLSGKISLKELGAAILKSSFLISVVSVPVHLASALKVPMIALFGPTCEKKWGPWNSPRSQVILNPLTCRPCYQIGCGGSGRSDCLFTLPKEKIFEAIERLL